MTQTIENSMKSTSQDMGQGHIDIHKNQHDFLQEDEPLVETLTPNNFSDDSFELALIKGVEQGLKTEDEWQVYNRKQDAKRRCPNYLAYVQRTCKKQRDGLQQKINSKKSPRASRAQAAEELAAARKNNGVPIDGSLFYISNVYDYPQQQELLKKYREFERKTFEEFYKSDAFQALNPGVFRAEIHLDEAGAMHLQTQAVCFHKDGLGRVAYAKRAYVKENLISFYGSEKELNRRLDLIAYLHHQREEQGDRENMQGEERIDSKFYKLLDSNFKAPKTSARERKGRIYDLWRTEQLHGLVNCALAVSKKLGVDWKPATTYQSDGHHRTRADYITHSAQEHGQLGQVQKLKNDIRELKAEKEKTRLEVVHKKTTLKRATKRKKVLDDASNDLRNAYQEITGKKPVSDKNKPLSMLEMARGINANVAKVKRENEEAEKGYKELAKQSASRPNLRNLIVNIIEKLMPILVDLWETFQKGEMSHQSWRDSVTEQVDRKLPGYISPSEKEKRINKQQKPED